MPQDDNRLKILVEEVLAGAKYPEASRNLLSLLFPKLGRVLEVNLPLDEKEDSGLKRGHRISQREFARTYFGLTPDPVSWGREELESILNMTPGKAMMVVEDRVSNSSEENQPRLRRQFLDALQGAFGSERPFTGEWLLSLVDFSPPYLRVGDLVQSLLYFTDNTQRFRTAIFVALKAQDPSTRGAVFVYAAERALDLSLLCSMFRTVVGDKNPSGVKNREREFFGEQTESIRDLLLDRVRNLARSSSFCPKRLPGTCFGFGGDATWLTRCGSLRRAQLTSQRGFVRS